MNKKLRNTNPNEPDRLSTLPDELLHQIFTFLGTRLVVQTSTLSKRWRHVWTTMPYLCFDGYDQLFPYTHSSIIKFMHHVLWNRNQDTHVFFFKLVAVYPFPPSVVRSLIQYPIDHKVEELDIDLQFHRYHPFKLNTFSSETLQKLKLQVPLDFNESMRSDSEWVLPVLETLHLICPPHLSNYELPESCLLFLPALTTLCLDGVELPQSLSSITVPNLTTLIMKRCKFPVKVWDIPGLLSLELDDVPLPVNMTAFFSALVNVRDITLHFRGTAVQHCVITCPHLLYLKISTGFSTFVTPTRTIVVVSEKLRELYCVGIFLVTLNVHELENVSLKLWDTNDFNDATLAQKRALYRRFIPMFSKLFSAKTLTLDSATIEALSTISVIFRRVPCPFKNLKYLKLLQGHKESDISTTLKSYLLGGNPRATIVTASPQSKLNHQVVPNSLTLQKENSVADADKMRLVGCSVAGMGKGNDQASSSRGNNVSGLLKGPHSLFGGLLDPTKKNYP